MEKKIDISQQYLLAIKELVWLPTSLARKNHEARKKRKKKKKKKKTASKRVLLQKAVRGGPAQDEQLLLLFVPLPEPLLQWEKQTPICNRDRPLIKGPVAKILCLVRDVLLQRERCIILEGCTMILFLPMCMIGIWLFFTEIFIIRIYLVSLFVEQMRRR